MIEKLFHHANVILDKNTFDIILDELKNKNNEVLCFLYDEDLEGGKNLHIDEVRSINNFVNTKTINKRYVLISKKIANTVIQNSLLKLLEEAKDNICFVIFVDNLAYLLPTVLSRVYILNLNNTENTDLYNNYFLNEKIQEIFNLKIKKLIENKNFKTLEKLMIIKDYYQKGVLPEKNFLDYINIL